MQTPYPPPPPTNVEYSADNNYVTGNLCMYHQEGGRGKYNCLWGLTGRFEQKLYSRAGGNEGGVVSLSFTIGKSRVRTLFQKNKFPGLFQDSDTVFQGSQSCILTSQWLHQQ